MNFVSTKLSGVVEIYLEPKCDRRGLFARTWCQQEFEEHGLNPRVVQCSVSFNHLKGTFRGMHYQVAPHEEAKLVRCTRGSVYDIVLDLRPGSATYTEWVTVVLNANERNMVYIPEGCAHGFLTLEDESELYYQMSAPYDPSAARGVRWDDPAFQICLPEAVNVIAERDLSYPNFEGAR